MTHPPSQMRVQDNRSRTSLEVWDAREPRVGGLKDELATRAWLFPGLGCRYVGMGNDLFGRDGVCRRLFEQAGSQLGFGLEEVCLTGSGRKHVPPRQEAQIIYVLDCAYAAELRAQGLVPSVVAGHSLGSLAAGWACGAFDFLTGLQLVTHIEELMEEQVDGRGFAMGVIIGQDADSIQSHLMANPKVCHANWNSPRQHVIAGPAADVDGVLAAALNQGAKQARRFGFERPIHTRYVAEVASRFQQRLKSISWSEPHVPMAVGSTLLRTANEIHTFLGDFLMQPVYWQATVQSIQITSGNGFLEVGPGNVLSSMLPFIDPTAKIHTASEFLERKAA